MKPHALEMVGVSKVYEVGGSELVALHHVDLVVADREVVTLVGPSGSGKTTLLAIAGGLLGPTSGRVVVGGEDITNARRRQQTRFRRRRVGFIFQAVNLVPFLNARENLVLMAELSQGSRRRARRRADQLLEELGLAARAENLPAQLSGGERQRVAIGRALMNEPDLVLVDEPTSALDSDLGEQVMQLIVSEVRARGAAAVIVTHDSRMTRFGDRILNMADGRIVSVDAHTQWTRPRPAALPGASPSPSARPAAARAQAQAQRPARQAAAANRGAWPDPPPPIWPSAWWGPPGEPADAAARAAGANGPGANGPGPGQQWPAPPARRLPPGQPGAGPRPAAANGRGQQPRVTGQIPRFTGQNPRVTGQQPRATGQKPRVTGEQRRTQQAPWEIPRVPPEEIARRTTPRRRRPPDR